MTVHVAVGVIRGADGRILLSRRRDEAHQGGLWEFPGGKVESGETVQDALARELGEELGILVRRSEPLIEVRHDYGDKQVLLDVWWVTAFSGTPTGREGQPLSWVAPAALSEQAFPAANLPIVQALLAAEPGAE
jgi:8-oxo-dGTP diphosphatase